MHNFRLKSASVWKNLYTFGLQFDENPSGPVEKRQMQTLMKQYGLILSNIIILLLLSFQNSAAQKTEEAQTIDTTAVSAALDNARPALEAWFKSYKLNGFEPNMSIRLDSVKMDWQNRLVKVWGNEGFASQTFTESLVKSVYKNIKDILPQKLQGYGLEVWGPEMEIGKLIPNIFNSKKDAGRMWRDTDYKGQPWTMRSDCPFNISEGLRGRHVVVWASHGRYWANGENAWSWQRPALYCTTEDLFTQSFVYPFLLPMLENAGAVCYTPRERDFQRDEAIVDNDNETLGGKYEESSNVKRWQNSPEEGFCMSKEYYSDGESPFKAMGGFNFITSDSDTIQSQTVQKGTARIIGTTQLANSQSSCTWTPKLRIEGEHAVYATYQCFANSADDADYTIVHKGMRTHVRVNQKIGGGTWVYLGTYNFGKGQSADNCVTLSNLCKANGIVCADAVKFGGGMGIVARDENGEKGETSGMPKALEGSRYYVQESGLPFEAYSTKDGHNDYADDINSRSNALNYLGGGSPFIPNTAGQRVPFELSLAIHSDAGYHFGNSIYGTLCVSTLQGDSSQEFFRSGMSRKASSDLADILQHTVCNDLSIVLNRQWPRREHYRRNYSETRKPEVPSAILETLSHQNFTDMRYGHDPNFKFWLSRCIYKGILRFITSEHDLPYCVQPLPVKNFSAALEGENKVRLAWNATTDTTEATAMPDGFIVYTRIGKQDFDNGRQVGSMENCIRTIEPGKIYSFKVTAFNKGGESFPSEVLSVFKAVDTKKTVLIINGFNRLSGPAIVQNNDSIGFDLKKDFGVAYQQTAEYCGEQTNFLRSSLSARNNSTGTSSKELQGQYIRGNNFDNTYVHGEALSKIKGVSFCSMSAAALEKQQMNLQQYNMVDLIFGLQKDDGESSFVKYKTFSPALQNALQNYCNAGGNVMVSGSYIASDMKTQTESAFTEKVLHYTAANFAPNSTRTATVQGNNIQFDYENEIDRRQYAVQHPDCLMPQNGAFTAFTYSDGASAGVAFKDKQSRIIALGFPFESVRTSQKRKELMKMIYRYLNE